MKARPAPPGAETVERDWLSGVPKAPVVAVDSTYIYFANPESHYVSRVKLDGTGLEAKWLDTGAQTFGPEALAIDFTYIYWTTDEGLGRAKKDGTEIKQPWIAGGQQQGLVLVGEYLYLNETTHIARVKTSGSGLEKEWIATPDISSNAITSDGTYLYWGSRVEEGGETRYGIARVKLDGTGLTIAWIAGLGEVPAYLTVQGSQLYWTNKSGINRVPLTGSPIERGWIPEVEAEEPSGLAEDASHLYWMEPGHGAIGRVVFG